MLPEGNLQQLSVFFKGRYASCHLLAFEPLFLLLTGLPLDNSSQLEDKVATRRDNSSTIRLDRGWEINC